MIHDSRTYETHHTHTHTNTKTLSWQPFCTVNRLYFFTYEWDRVHEQMSHPTHTKSHSARANESHHTHTHTYIDTHTHSQSQHLSNTSTLLSRHIPRSQDAVYKWVTSHTHTHTHTHRWRLSNTFTLSSRHFPTLPLSTARRGGSWVDPTAWVYGTWSEGWGLSV